MDLDAYPTTHELRQLTPRVWWMNPVYTTDRPVIGVVVGEQGTLVVEAGNSAAHVRLLQAELERHDLPAPSFVALTHWHWDHIFGGAAFAAPLLAGAETQRIVRRLASFEWSDAALDERVADGREIAFCRDMLKLELPDPAARVVRVPEIGFAGELNLDLGGITCRLALLGGDHSPDGILVHLPQERVAFIGDALYDDIYHGPRRLTTAGLFPLLDTLLGLDVDHYIAGHHPQPIGRAELEAEAATMRQIGVLVERCGDRREEIMQALPAAIETTPSERHAELVDAFLAGLRLPQVGSPL
jgi:glyoxylase-like metal-dependent hydrolase (beta-lactamase superfamily II)